MIPAGWRRREARQIATKVIGGSLDPEVHTGRTGGGKPFEVQLAQMLCLGDTGRRRCAGRACRASGSLGANPSLLHPPALVRWKIALY